MTKLEGASYGPHNEGKPGHMVILLHGYGADGNDLIGLAPVMGPLMPDVIFYAPNAPQACEGNPFGYQWFPVSRLDPELALVGVRGGRLRARYETHGDAGDDSRAQKLRGPRRRVGARCIAIAVDRDHCYK